MRLLSYSIGGRPGYGVLHADGTGIVTLHDKVPGAPDLDALLRSGRLGEAARLATLPPEVPVADVRYERLLLWPRKIFCIGVNYGGRAGEYEDPTAAAYPSVFVRFPDSLTGHEQPLVRPPESEQLDYEGEIVAVIGTAGRRIPVERARDHLAGLALGNEGTVRDWVRHAKFNVTQGKNWEASGALGPHLVTMDELPALDSLHLTTTVGGELRQDDTTASMAYPIAYLVHYLSTFTALAPGDVIFTGTPTGAGARMDPPRWLAPGDVVEVHVPELGTLRNPVIDEPVPGRAR